MGLLKDRWRLTKSNKSKKPHVLQIQYHPGDGRGGVNSSFKVGQDLNRRQVHAGDFYKQGRSYIRALYSFKNVKSLEAAIRNLKRHNPQRIFRGRWTEMIEGKLTEHIIIKKGKVQFEYLKSWEKIN